MKSNLICMLITIVAYLVLMIIVGIACSRKNKDVSDFYLGGRRLGPDCYGNECGSLRHEQLAAHGTARALPI